MFIDKTRLAYLASAIATICIIATTLVFLHCCRQRQAIVKELGQELQKQTVHENLVDLFSVYSAYDQNGPIELVRHGKEHDGGYIVPIKAFKHADVLLGYGIDRDNSFEDDFSIKYNKPSYGFDCGIDQIDSKSKLFTFVKECIGTDAFLYDKPSSPGLTTSFGQQVKGLGLEDKKLFIKMDIEGAEYEVFDDILSHHDNITGIVLEIHFPKIDHAKKARYLLQRLQKHFVLVHLHGNNCCGSEAFNTTNAIGKVPVVIELTYINKSLVTRYALSDNQSHPTKLDQTNVQHLPEATFTIVPPPYTF